MNAAREQRTDDNGYPAGWRPAIRSDRGKLSKAEKTPAGGVRVDGVIARAGIYEYRKLDGSVVRELLPPEEAARADSLSSLRDAPITVHHPDGGARMVSPETYRRDSVGHVSGEPRADNGLIVASLAIQEADAIKRIDAGELVELSPGYTLMIEPTSGVWNGQRYDAIQRNRSYNHVALLPKGAARGGSVASLRVDGIDDVAIGGERIDDDRTPARVPERGRLPELRADSMKTERIDGIEYEIGSVAWQQARARFDEKQAKRIADLEAALKTAQDDAAKEKARADAAERRAKELEVELAPDRLDARARSRASLLAVAQPLLGKDEKLDGLTDHEIRTKVVEKLDPDFKADSIPEAQREVYVSARFDAETRKAKTAGGESGATGTSALGQARREAVAPTTEQTDAFDDDADGRLEDRWKRKR